MFKKAEKNPYKYKPEGFYRKEIYDLIKSWGIDVAGEKHDKLKKLLVEMNLARTEDLTVKCHNAQNAVWNSKIPPKIITIRKRIKDMQCPMCGLNMENNNGVYSSKCGHLEIIGFVYL